MFIGGVITMFYPDFLESQTFFDLRSLSGLLHHTVMVWIVIICMLTKYIVPNNEKMGYFFDWSFYDYDFWSF